MRQINARHNFLDRFIGTKELEDISYSKASEVNLWVTVMTCVCCILEMVLYFAYNRMVNIVCKFFLIISLKSFYLVPSLDWNHLWRCCRDQRS